MRYRRQIGVVRELFRYPVKSMLGERLTEAEVTVRGLVGDRAWALREASNGRVVTAKKWANMLEFHASYDSPPEAASRDELPAVTIQLPDGRVLHAADPSAAATISGVLGRPVTLVRAQADERAHAEIDPRTVFGNVAVEDMLPGLTAANMPDTFGLPRGTFFDSAMIHVIASGTLEHVRELIGGDARTDPRRFRPNIVVETDPRGDSFAEDEWLEGVLEIGSVRIIKLEAALRCVMTTHQQTDLPRDPRILRTVAQQHKAKLGVFAAIGAAGRIRVGDPVHLAA